MRALPMEPREEVGAATQPRRKTLLFRPHRTLSAAAAAPLALAAARGVGAGAPTAPRESPLSAPADPSPPHHLRYYYYYYYYYHHYYYHYYYKR